MRSTQLKSLSVSPQISAPALRLFKVTKTFWAVPTPERWPDGVGRFPMGLFSAGESHYGYKKNSSTIVFPKNIKEYKTEYNASASDVRESESQSIATGFDSSRMHEDELLFKENVRSSANDRREFFYPG